MNITTRRTITTLAGLGLAASAFASTGPAAVAVKPGGGGTGGGGGGTVQPFDIETAMQINDEGVVVRVDLYYEVEVAPRSVKSVTCTLDDVAITDCGTIDPAAKGWAIYRKTFMPVAGAQQTGHTFKVTISTGKSSYAGTTTFTVAI